MSFMDWLTNNNNIRLDREDFLYKPRHLLVLGLVLLFSFLIPLIMRKKSYTAKRKLLIVFASIFLFFEVITRILNICFEENPSFTNILKIILPAHICSVMVWVMIVAVFSNNKILLNFAVIGGFLATAAFLLYPAVGLNYVYFSFSCLYSTFTHALGFVLGVCVIAFGMVKFEWKKIWQPFLCFTIMFLWGVLLNFVIFPGSDYMYMINNPLPIDFGIPYQFIFALLICIYISAFYFIPWLYHKIKNKRKI